MKNIADRKQTCNTCPNKNCFFQLCDESSREFLLNKKKVESYKKGQTIILENSPVDNLYVILSGKAKVYNSGVFRKKQIIRFVTDGDIIGHRGINQKKWTITASALDDSQICTLSMQDFFCLLDHNLKLTRTLLFFLADELFRAEMEIKKLSTMYIEERVADALLHIKSVFSPEGASLGVKLSRQDIADFAGTTKEQVSKYLSDFKRNSVIDMKGKTISILDLNRLQAIARVQQNKLYNKGLEA